LTHYYKLVQINDGTSPIGSIRNVRTNPRTAEYPEDLQTVSHLFNAVYRSLYLVMDRLFAAEAKQGRAVGVLYLLMADVLSNLGHFLVQQPIGDGEYAAPTFEWFNFETDTPLAEMTALSETAVETFPELASIHQALRGLGLIL
jgi:hypothetical protein